MGHAQASADELRGECNDSAAGHFVKPAAPKNTTRKARCGQKRCFIYLTAEGHPPCAHRLATRPAWPQPSAQWSTLFWIRSKSIPTYGAVSTPTNSGHYVSYTAHIRWRVSIDHCAATYSHCSALRSVLASSRLMPISPAAVASLQPPTTRTRCVPVFVPASANSTETSMRTGHLLVSPRPYLSP